MKFADGGPKKRQQTQQNHGNVLFIHLILDDYHLWLILFSSHFSSEQFILFHILHHDNNYAALKTKNQTGVK